MCTIYRWNKISMRLIKILNQDNQKIWNQNKINISFLVNKITHFYISVRMNYWYLNHVFFYFSQCNFILCRLNSFRLIHWVSFYSRNFIFFLNVESRKLSGNEKFLRRIHDHPQLNEERLKIRLFVGDTRHWEGLPKARNYVSARCPMQSIKEFVTFFPVSLSISVFSNPFLNNFIIGTDDFVAFRMTRIFLEYKWFFLSNVTIRYCSKLLRAKSFFVISESLYSNQFYHFPWESYRYTRFKMIYKSILIF